MLDFVAESKTPLVTTVGSSALVQPMDEKKNGCSRRRRTTT